MDWIFYSLIAVCSLGVSMSLYKMPTFRGYSSLHSTFWTNLFSLIFSIIIFIIFAVSGDSITNISFYGLLWGVFFALTMAQQKVLLKRIETNTLLPITSSLGNILTVFLGIILFSESISLLGYFAITLIIISTFLYNRKDGGLVLDANSLTLGIGIIVTSTITKVIQKFGATHDSIVHFSFFQYLGASLCALFLIYVFEKNSLKQIFDIRQTCKMSLTISCFSTIGGYSLLKALSSGPLSGVYAIQPSYLIITAIMGVILYKEKLTKYKICLILLTILGVILIKIR